MDNKEEIEELENVEQTNNVTFEKIEIEDKVDIFPDVKPRTEMTEMSKDEKEEIKKKVIENNSNHGYVDKEGLNKSLQHFSLFVIVGVLFLIISAIIFCYLIIAFFKSLGG